MGRGRIRGLPPRSCSALLPPGGSADAGCPPSSLVGMDKGIAAEQNLERLESGGATPFRRIGAQWGSKSGICPGNPRRMEDRPSWPALRRTRAAPDFSTPGATPRPGSPGNAPRSPKPRGMPEAEHREIQPGLGGRGSRKGVDYLNKRIGRIQETRSTAARHSGIKAVPGSGWQRP